MPPTSSMTPSHSLDQRPELCQPGQNHTVTHDTDKTTAQENTTVGQHNWSNSRHSHDNVRRLLQIPRLTAPKVSPGRTSHSAHMNGALMSKEIILKYAFGTSCHILRKHIHLEMMMLLPLWARPNAVEHHPPAGRSSGNGGSQGNRRLSPAERGGAWPGAGSRDLDTDGSADCWQHSDTCWLYRHLQQLCK